jgi:hypothetical protein
MRYFEEAVKPTDDCNLRRAYISAGSERCRSDYKLSLVLRESKTKRKKKKAQTQCTATITCEKGDWRAVFSKHVLNASFYFGYPRGMMSSLESSLQECLHHLLCHVNARVSGSECQNVCVVVLSSKTKTNCNVGVSARRFHVREELPAHPKFMRKAQGWSG